jgi:NADH dehydrogenase
LTPHRVVIVGGGFGGLHAARSLRRAPVDVTLVDRRNFHLFQPLLYQVATGALSPANIAGPLRSILKRQRNARVLLGEVADFDPRASEAVLADGQRLPYDSLIVATGASHNYFGRDEWAALAPGLKTVEDATDIRRRILLAFEAAERENDPARVAAWLTFVVVGGGATGVELAGALCEIARDTLRHDFRAIDPTGARIVLVEGAARVLPGFPAALSARTGQALARLGVVTRTETLVTRIAPEWVILTRAGVEERVPCRTVLWAAGIQGSPLAGRLAAAFGAGLDRAGRVIVEPDLSLQGRPEVMVIGDLAHCLGADGRPLPGVAQVAIQQGRHAARAVVARLRGRSVPSFRYRDYGNLATIGRNEAVADLPWLRTEGRVAWFLWLFIHLLWLVQFHNRLLVLLQWAWNYITRNRTARLITGEDRLPFVTERDGPRSA